MKKAIRILYGLLALVALIFVSDTLFYGKKLGPGLIYVFKISPTGQLVPETVPDL